MKTPTNFVSTKIEQGQSFTLDDIANDLNSGNDEPLYFADEAQIDTLIRQGRIDEDFSSRYQDFQEEMRCMQAEFA